ncbi:inositol monophosphatase ttx-7 [Acrasis kona]|uniref:Inositol-1-monophosphatase n=1 Tax=Acrasis kona TaxID=1008807 RepID=A0AAW2Z765_9EUKA
MYTFDVEQAKAAALEAAYQAGVVIRDAFSNVNKKMDTKSAVTDIVTETDVLAEKIVIDRLKAFNSSFVFVSEETNNKIELTDAPTWIIDPIDGTTNFVHSFPFVAVSIGLAVNKQCVLGVVYNPILEETYSAIKGQGAFRKNKDGQDVKITSSAVTEISRSLLSTNYPYDRSTKALNDVHEKMDAFLKQNCRGVRFTGSAVINLVYVASGQLEAYFENGLQIWDIAAGKVIVEEAGGVVIDPCGGEIDISNRRVLAACTSDLAKQLASGLKQVEDKYAEK